MRGALANMAVQIDANQFGKRLKALYEAWKVRPRSLGAAACVCA